MATKVWITGASSGLGAALARHYAAQDVHLGLVARRGDRLRDIAASLPAPAETYLLDVTDAAAHARAAQDFIARVGVPDIVIANAGVSVGTLTEEVDDLAVFARVMAINVQGAVNTFHPFVSALRARGSGRLVGIGSVAGVRGLPGAGAYSASKAALAIYLESLRVELRGSGVRVVTIAPGYIHTPMTAVNTYAMPFMLPAEVAARRIARAIDRGVRHAVVPWQMALVARLLRWLPDAAFDAMAARAGRKPRGLEL